MRAILALCMLVAPAVSSAGDRYLVSPDGTYLGNLNENQFDPNSVSNQFGRYGNQFSPDSINNQFGEYGSPFSNKSAHNPYATEEPIVIEDQ
jgi:hypothetical protein